MWLRRLASCAFLTFGCFHHSLGENYATSFPVKYGPYAAHFPAHLSAGKCAFESPESSNHDQICEYAVGVSTRLSTCDTIGSLA